MTARLPTNAAPIFLVGFMGSGKSVVGQALADLMGRQLLDLDHRIEQLEGRSIPEIFSDAGEAYFRELEQRVLEQEGAAPQLVVATGGGLFARRAARRFMSRTGRTVWLDVSLETARQRVGAGAGRPLWDLGRSLEMRALFERRRTVYALACHRIDASSSDPNLVARQVQAVCR